MQLLGKTVLMSPQKLKIELPCDPATPLLSIYLTDTILYLYLYVHCSVVDNSYDMETMLLSIDEWMGKCDIYTQWDIINT